MISQSRGAVRARKHSATSRLSSIARATGIRATCVEYSPKKGKRKGTNQLLFSGFGTPFTRPYIKGLFIGIVRIFFVCSLLASRASATSYLVIAAQAEAAQSRRGSYTCSRLKIEIWIVCQVNNDESPGQPSPSTWTKTSPGTIFLNKSSTFSFITNKYVWASPISVSGHTSLIRLAPCDDNLGVCWS